MNTWLELFISQHSSQQREIARMMRAKIRASDLGIVQHMIKMGLGMPELLLATMPPDAATALLEQMVAVS